MIKASCMSSLSLERLFHDFIFQMTRCNVFGLVLLSLKAVAVVKRQIFNERPKHMQVTGIIKRKVILVLMRQEKRLI